MLRREYRVLEDETSMKRNIGILWTTLIILPTIAGCGKKMVAPPPPPLAETILEDSGTERLQESLFKGDQAVLSDQDIARILGTQLTLADRHRLAMLSLSSTNPWSEDLADTETKNFEGLLRALKSSPQLTEVHLLPSLLVPQKRTVPYLREAAARIQADLLFVYTARIQTFRKDRFLKSDGQDFVADGIGRVGKTRCAGQVTYGIA